MQSRLTRYATPKVLVRLSTGLSVAAIVGALTAAFASNWGKPASRRPQVPIEILRTRPAPLVLPRQDPEPPPRQTN